jgi:hypothetical protein
MKQQLSNVLVILIVSVAVGINGVPVVASSAAATTAGTARAFITPPVGGTINPGPVGGQMASGAVGGALSADGFIQPLTPGPTFVNGIPSQILYIGSNGIPRNLAPLGRPGGTWSGSGVGGVKSSVIVAGGANNLPGGTWSGNGVGGVKSSVIVAGGANNPPGGTLSGSGVGGVKSSVIVAGGTGETLSGGYITGSASSVIVTGGSQP